MKQKLFVTFAIVLSVFAVLFIADQVMAGEIFLPLIKNGSAQEDTIPSGVLYVFTTQTTTNGSIGRIGMQALCTAEDPQSHFCHNDELQKLGEKGVFWAETIDTAWLDIGFKIPDNDYGIYHPLGRNSTVNCNGWTKGDTIDPSYYGWTLQSDAFSLDFEQCQESYAVTCCKNVP